jgi:serine/threonine protein phosphatase 1
MRNPYYPLMQKRTLFIGDVHGCYDELMMLCEKIVLTPEDHLYFVGDLIDKWPKSLEVLEFVHSRPHTFSVAGNHEYFMMLGEEDVTTEDGRSEIRSVERYYSELKNILIESWWKDWIRALPIVIEKEDFIVVHGGIHPISGLSASPEVTTNIRVYQGKPWYEYYTGTKKVIYGHWAAAGLRVTSNTVGLDTGCCFGGHLTAYCIETGEFWQMRAQAVNSPPNHWWGI